MLNIQCFAEQNDIIGHNTKLVVLMRVPCRPAAAPLINIDQLSDFANRIKPGAQICMVKAWPTRENYQRRFLSKAGCCIQSAPNYIKIEFRPVDAQFHVTVSFDSS